MTNRVRIFIDGSWLSKSRGVFARELGREVVLDFEALPLVLAAKAAETMGLEDYAVTGTQFFGSFPVNYDPQDEGLVRKQLAFFSVLRNKFWYKVEIYPIDFRGHRVQKDERGEFVPHEKEVDSALATALVDGAAEDSYDTAVCVLGDRDFLPAVARTRKHGKKIMLASVGGSCSRAYIPGETVDAPTLWLEEFFGEIELLKDFVCSASYHPAALPREFSAPAKSASAAACYCELCSKLAEKLRLKEDASSAGIKASEFSLSESTARQASVVGTVTKVVPERSFGFITARDHRRYFFHVSDIVGVARASVKCGMSVLFDIGNEPSLHKAGKSIRIRLCGGPEPSFQPV